MTEYSNKIILECPYCIANTQFNELNKDICDQTDDFHITYQCAKCRGIILSVWSVSINRTPSNLKVYYKLIGDFKPQVNLDKIENEYVKKDFKEAIECYNNGFYNACMVMTRRAIHQEMDYKKAKGGNLYEKINSVITSDKLRQLLNKVKNFGNAGAHPDFFLYDENGNRLIPEENEKDFARLSLIFLDKYFQDQYELQDLINSAPNSEIEMKNKNK